MTVYFFPNHHLLLSCIFYKSITLFSPSALTLIIFFMNPNPLFQQAFVFLRNYQTSAVGLVRGLVGIPNGIFTFSGHWAPFVVDSSEVVFLSLRSQGYVHQGMCCVPCCNLTFPLWKDTWEQRESRERVCIDTVKLKDWLLTLRHFKISVYHKHWGI